MIYTLFLHRSPNLDNAPFQTNLTKEWTLLRVNSYTANPKAPCWKGETISRASYCSEASSRLHSGFFEAIGALQEFIWTQLRGL